MQHRQAWVGVTTADASDAEGIEDQVYEDAYDENENEDEDKDENGDEMKMRRG